MLMGQSWWKIGSYLLLLLLLKRKKTLNEALLHELDFGYGQNITFFPLCFSGQWLFKGWMLKRKITMEQTDIFALVCNTLINARIIRGINCSIQCQLHMNINLAHCAKAVAVANANDFHHSVCTVESLAALWIDWHGQVVFGLVGSFNAFTTILTISNTFTFFSTAFQNIFALLPSEYILIQVWEPGQVPQIHCQAKKRKKSQFE